MPRVIRDSDEEVETKSATRRTRASSASVTDSPARRTTRSNKQLTIIESSPESFDDSNAQPQVRTTRRRTATLDKSTTAGIAKNLRSRKNSASSNVSETIDLEPETTQRRVTRKATATAAIVGTPTKTNLRSRNLRAGSEAKSTPPTTTRSTRVTRASSVDPVNVPNESVGTPVKRRTRASIVPAQQTVTEEEAQNKTPESLNNTVVEICEDSENESVSSKGKSKKKVAKNKIEIVKDSSTDQSNLDTSKSNEENMADKSCTSNDSHGDSTLKALTSHSVTSKLESFTFAKIENPETINEMANSESLVLLTDQKLLKPDESHLDSNENNSNSVKSRIDINDDECEHVDVENFTLTDDSIDVVNSPKKVDAIDPLTLDIKDSYVKLDRTNLVEKIISEKLEVNKDSDNSFEKLNDSDYVSQNIVITNAKTAIVLVNDFVKSNEYFKNMKDQQIFDSGISLNNREDKNSNNSAHNSDDQMSIVSIDDNDEVLSLKLASPNGQETQNEKLIVEVLPDNEKNYFNKVTNESIPMNVNNVIVHNSGSEKSDACLKENASESKLKSENLIGEKNNNLENVSALNVVRDNVVETVGELGDELLLEKTSEVESFEMINASGGTVAISNSLDVNVQRDDSVSMDVDDDAIVVSVNVESPTVDKNLTATESVDDDAINKVAETSEIESAYEFNNANSNVDSNRNVIIEKNDSVSESSIKAEQRNRVTDANEQLELTESSKSDPSNPKENRDIANPCVVNEISSNEIVPKLCLEDKNAVPSAVTDADGDNASSPVKEEEKQHEISTDTTSTKSPEKSKRKSKARVIDSDLDESAENLFQDIAADEWSEEQSKRQSNQSKRTSEIGNESVKLDEYSFSKDKSVNGEDDGKRDRKSFDEKEQDTSLVEIINETDNQEADLSLSKKGRKSGEKKRESGQSSDSGIQDSGNKTVVDNDADENDHAMNESNSKSRRSLDHSLKANQSLSAQDKNGSISETLSKSLVDRKSLNKNRKSLNDSNQFNVSVFDNFRKKNDNLSTSLNASNVSRRQSLSDTRKSIAEQQTDENSELEAMDVDEVEDIENELNKSNASSKKSEKTPSKNDSIAEKSSTSLSASKIAKRLSLDKSLNKSSRKSTIEPIQEEKVTDSEEIDVDSNTSTKEAANNKSLSKSQNFVNESPSQNDDLSENVLSTSLNESKKLKKRLSEKFNDSTCKLVVEERNKEEKSQEKEMEVDVISDKLPNKLRKSLDEPSSNKSLNKSRKSLDGSSSNKSLIKNERESEVSLNHEDKSLKEKSNRKFADKSLNSSDLVVDDDSESEVVPNQEDEMKKKSNNKSPKTPSKSSINTFNDEDTENTEDSMTKSSLKTKKGQEAKSTPSSLDRSLQKSIERMKFTNPPKHDVSTIVHVNSTSEQDSDDSDDSDSDRVLKYIFKLSDEDVGEEEKEENDVDSDIEREYNLGGNSITKYSDDDVPGDDCRVSEEESSEDEDDGNDLQDFIIPDEEIEDDEDEDEDEDEDGDEDEDEDDEDGDGDEVENDGKENEDVDVDGDESEDEDANMEVSKEKKSNVSKKNISVSSTQTTLENASTHLRRSGFSQSSGSESDDEATETEIQNSKERFEESEKLLQDSKVIKDKNISLQKKHESMDKSSKFAKNHEFFKCIYDDEGVPNKSQTKTKTDKNISVSAKSNKSSNVSKSNKEKSAISSSKTNSSKSDKNKSVRMEEENVETESSSSESDGNESSSKDNRSKRMQIASPSETESESESEESEDSYHILNVESRDASLLKPKNKKLIDCSTPKPGTIRKTDFSSGNLSILSSKRKSGSLNDLSGSKIMSSRQSIGEAAASKSMKVGDTSMKLKDDVEIVATPDTVGKTRQAWKLIPLNHTAHPAVEDTPGTKFLKKAKLNDSFPVLESMKSADLSSSSKKKSSKAVERNEPAVQLESVKKSKKRKLLDMSNAQSIDEDSILKVSKSNKKRARFEDSTIEEQMQSTEQSSRKKTEHGKQAADTAETPEKVPKNKKKKKKSQANEAEIDKATLEQENVPEKVEEKPTKKRKKKLLGAQEASDEEGENVEPEKSKKKKSKVCEAKQVESQGSKSKKIKKQVADSSGDEAPDILDLKEARWLALNEMQQELERAKAAKQSLKMKRKDPTELPLQQHKPTKSLKRLPEDILDNLADEPLRRPDKRQKLSRNKERSVIIPSKSMFSPGKVTPENLRVDDGYVPLSSAGGTTQFAVINLQKASRKVAKKNTAVLNFREKMLARNARMPTSVYLSYLKKQKAKSGK